MNRKDINCYIVKDKNENYYVSSTPAYLETVHIPLKVAKKYGLFFNGESYLNLFNSRWKKFLVGGSIELNLIEGDFIIMKYFFNDIYKEQIKKIDKYKPSARLHKHITNEVTGVMRCDRRHESVALTEFSKVLEQFPKGSYISETSTNKNTNKLSYSMVELANQCKVNF